MSRQTIGQNPLDTLLTPSESKESLKKKKTPSKVQRTAVPDSNDNVKQRLTVQISAEILERAKNSVYWTRGLTLAQFTEQALEKAIVSLEKGSTIFNDETGEALKAKGESFPQRREELKSGRPVK